MRKKTKIFYDQLIRENPNPTYNELLNTFDWDIKRWEVLRRDNKQCQKCNSLQRLIVHHKKYIHGLLPWEYSDEDLITLCEDCHAKEHNKEAKGYVPKTWFKDPSIKNINVRLNLE